MAARPARRARDAAALRAGPWCWPPADTIAFETRVLDQGEPPAPRPGHVAAVTVRGRTTTLWHLQPAGAGVGAGSSTLGADARASWRAASIALPRALPVLWRSVHEAASEPPVVRRLRATVDGPGFEERDALVDGPSFGLAFFLLLASSVLDCAVPGDVLASAGIDAYGRLRPVDGLRQKVDGVCALAPGVTRFVVAADQAGEAVTAARGRLEVIGAAHAAEALDRVFGDRLSRLLVTAGTDPARRAELTASFFRLALVGRGAAIDWTPVARGAGQALREWVDLHADERYRLQFAQAVAERHEANAGDLPLPEPGWLARTPRVLRVQLLSHLVQQSADTGTPDAAKVEALAASEMAADPHEAFVPQLRLHGALCRLWALTGRAARALDDNARLARVARDVFTPAEASFPVSEWLRLAGALGDAAAFACASDMRQQILTEGGFGEHGTPYVTLAWARGRLLLVPGDVDAEAAAAALSDDPAVPAHVRWSAHRWAGGAHHRRLADEAESSAMARRYHVLARLDAAIAHGQHDDADRLIDALLQLDPGPVGHLRRHGAAADAVARLYPY